MDKHQTLLQLLQQLRRGLLPPQQPVPRQQPSPTRAPLRIPFSRLDTMNQLQPRPQSSGVLPPAPRSAEPLAQYGARGDQPSLWLQERPGDRGGLGSGAHGHSDDGTQQVGAHGEAGSLGYIVHVGCQLQPIGTFIIVGFPTVIGQRRRHHDSQKISDRHVLHLACLLQTRWHNARSHQPRLEQPQVVGAVVENLGDVREQHGGLQIHRGQTDCSRVGRGEPQPALDGRCGEDGIAAVIALALFIVNFSLTYAVSSSSISIIVAALLHGQVDRAVDHPRRLRVIHPQEEYVGPARVAQIHPHRSSFQQARTRGGTTLVVRGKQLLRPS
mmetsp:Transcript_21884/g.46839  ORF Transcript_21884/g.46839 Transcript_21884/m.46839 type:complete len:328 (-) Transcript_21884:1122-2105(-)